MVSIQIFNLSTVMTDQEITTIVTACLTLVKTFCKIWSIMTPIIIFNKSKNVTFTTTYWSFVIADNTDQVDALAYHGEYLDKIYGYVFAKTILDNGGVKFYGGRDVDTVGSALFHEIAESLIDPMANKWWDDGANTLYAAEVCDPVQGNIIPITTGPKRIVVGLSDFIYPAWSYSDSTSRIYNHTNSLTAPFTLDHGGYLIKRTDSVNEYIFSENNVNANKIKQKNSIYSRLIYRGAKISENKPSGQYEPLIKN